jgi:hypothetical protein
MDTLEMPEDLQTLLDMLAKFCVKHNYSYTLTENSGTQETKKCQKH